GRSEARVAALAADIHAVAPSAAHASRPRSESPNLFSAPSAPASARPAIVVGVGLLMFATAAALLVVLGGSAASRSGARDAAGRPASSAVPPSTIPARVPLELVALGHDRDGDRLTVRGVVRNPAAGTRVEGLTAVV